MKRGQGAFELIILLGLGLAVLLIIFQVSSGSLLGYQSLFREDQARDALQELASAGSSVYQQGVGAKTQVFVSLPEGINASSVSGKVLRFDFYTGNTVFQDLSFNASGQIPRESGGYWITVESFSSFVNYSTSFPLPP